MDQREENRRRIGELAMAFMDDLEEEFGEEAILRDFMIVGEIEHGEPLGNQDADVAHKRSSIRYRCSSWRPLIVEGLASAAKKLVEPVPYLDNDDDSD